MNDEMATKPTLETLLARINEWGASLGRELAEIKAGQNELRNGQDELRKGQEQLRADLKTGLHRVERKIEILNDNLLTINADIRDLEVRLEKLETESLAKS
jgi:septal ring factor EnvC (AmiA/AmiB activator)